MAGEGGRNRELDALRARLDALESRFSEEVSSIRERIESLEGREDAAAEVLRVESPPAAKPWSPAPRPVVPPPLPPQEPEETDEPAPVAGVLTPRTPDAPPAEIETDGSFELKFGRVWLVRIGIALLVTGLVLLGNYAYRNWIRDLSAGVRLAALYGCALVLFESGRRFAKRGNLRAFGEVVLAGGLAFFYYCTFAAHHVARLRVIESPVLAAVLLALAAAGIAAVSWLRRAKGTAVLGVVLASYAVMLQPIGWMSCISAVILAATGLFFATRPGWNVPGWASLLASYGSFVGWQVLGAAPVAKGDPVLWFLPFVWLLFALPTITGHFREAMGDRSRAWFTGANNGLFFLLYSGAWLMRHGDGRYWLVVGVIGLAWLACGVLGRRRSESAGGTHVAQALACLSLALVLKLDGWHLGLSLAGESLALAVAFLRFRGRSELVFCLLAGAGAAAILCGAIESPGDWEKVPAWSAALAAVVLAVSSFFVWLGSRKRPEAGKPGARIVSRFLFAGAMLSLVFGWASRLDPEWRSIAMLAVSPGMAAASFWLDRGRRWPDPGIGALALLVPAVAWMLPPETWALAPSLAAVALAAGSCLVWHNLAPVENKVPPAWWGTTLSSVITALAMWIAVVRCDGSATAEALGLCGGGVALIGLGALIRCGPLAPCGSALGIAASLRWIAGAPQGPSGFAVVAGVLVMAAVWLVPGFIRRIGMPAVGIHMILLRVAFSCSWVLAWVRSTPRHWGEWLAVSSIACMLAVRPWKRLPPVETILYLSLGVIWWMFSISAPPEPGAPAGWAVVAAFAVLLWMATTGAFGELADPRIRSVVSWMTVAASALWVTRGTVVAFDGWKPVAVSWTLLGFLLVTAGLAGRLLPLRVGGFLVLGAALAKVFAVDVWDFNAFLRVVAFIVLGVALLLLGLFYHRFAPMLRSLFESDAEEAGEVDE